MKKLCLIRHAKSDWANAQLEDIDRPLNARGYADANTMSLRLKNAGILPDGICSSSAIRACTTALIFARAFGMSEKECIFTPKLYGASESEFIHSLSSLPDKWETVFMFGHNPTITEVANELSGQTILNIPTCGIVMVEFDAATWAESGNGRLLLFDFPKNKSIS
jgi:phosphohistidine phosphatase